MYNNIIYEHVYMSHIFYQLNKIDWDFILHMFDSDTKILNDSKLKSKQSSQFVQQK